MGRAEDIGLPAGVIACLFDLDGVLTDTARVHRAAWRETFDALLREQGGEGFAPFTDAEYAEHVDGLPRDEGVRAFLRSRGIELEEGNPDDPPTARTVHGVGRAKNDALLARIRAGGVEAYAGSVRYLHAARDAGLRRVVVSSSANTRDALAAAGVADLVEAVIDGVVAAERGLPGKPAPDTFLAGAEAVGAAPAHAAVFEDALAGVEAGRAGGFGFVLGVDRAGQADALREHGADRVVTDLSDLLEPQAPSS